MITKVKVIMSMWANQMSLRHLKNFVKKYKHWTRNKKNTLTQIYYYRNIYIANSVVKVAKDCSQKKNKWNLEKYSLRLI